MTQIACIELYHVRIPLDKPFYPSWIPGYPLRENRFDLVRVITRSGIEGFSAGPAIARERQGLGHLIAPYLIGHDAADIDLMLQRLREVSYLGVRAGWMEPAFWDIKGKFENKPVYELLGGRAGPVEVYASTGEIRNETSRVYEAEQRLGEGFKTIKIRVHDFDVETDIRHVRAVKDAVGDRMAIGVDANQGWRVTIINDAPLWDLSRARYFADACADMGIAWLEEPLPMDDYKSLAELTRYSRVPVAGGEIQTNGRAELKYMVEQKCYDIFQPDAVMTGGIAHALEVAEHCRAHGLKFTPHTWTNGIGFAVNLNVLLASGFNGVKPLEYPVNPPSWTVEKRDAILKKPFMHQRGVITPSPDPGLGFEIDGARLRKYGTRFFSMNKRKLMFYTIKEKGLFTALKINSNRKKYGVKSS
ncbi:mandelate racemase/muconate lactonizing enzyme family protein [Desulfospira joergensenii]|uniref:mandelate racemase/muconate lactonizing enzyme family protein n=1 Tax=Desulfospira joergensenii TaxID=53329 RepID=UPI0003B4B62C|nr:mandelate racemase/muconate lactonizing enzyme family protein [Desulfospira joergensenii]